MPLPKTDFAILPYQSPTQSPISLNSSSTWTHCGPILDPTCLPPSFHAWAESTVNGDLLPSLLPFLAFVHCFITENRLDHYWLTIRATRGNHDFDMPRWHTDRKFFQDETSGRVHWKLCTTLVGPGTLFLSDGRRARAVQKHTRKAMRDAPEFRDHACREVRCLGCAGMQEVVRERLAEKLREYEVIQSAAGECAFFRVGDDVGAVHSEPESHGDRVFVNVVPGTEAEMKNLASMWGMEFPRAWSLSWYQ